MMPIIMGICQVRRRSLTSMTCNLFCGVDLWFAPGPGFRAKPDKYRRTAWRKHRRQQKLKPKQRGVDEEKNFVPHPYVVIVITPQLQLASIAHLRIRRGFFKNRFGT